MYCRIYYSVVFILYSEHYKSVNHLGIPSICANTHYSTMLVCNAKSVLDINHWFLPAKQAMLEMPGNLHHSKMCKML